MFIGCLFALVALIAGNLAFRWVYLRKLQKDEGFAEHHRVFPKTCMVIYFTGVVFSFKASHLYYSYLFGRPEFDVQFSQRKRFHKLLDRLSLFNACFVLTPLLLVCIVALFLHDWGKT